MTCLTFACHAAHLNPMTGDGLLILPDPAADLADPFSISSLTMHEAAWGAALQHLDGMGWEPSEDECGGLSYVGRLDDGRSVIALYGREPVISAPSVAESAEAFADLCREVGVRVS